MIQTVLKRDTQFLLRQAYDNPEEFSFALKNEKVYIQSDHFSPMCIGTLNTDDIPSVAIPMLKIKSWRLDKSQEDILSLRVCLTI